MAAIRKRGRRWQVQVRRAGFLAETKTFKTLAEARCWASSIESQQQQIGAPSAKSVAALTLRRLIERYQLEITPKKKTAVAERIRLNALLREPFVDLPLRELSAAHFTAFRDRRASQVKGWTVIHDMNLYSHVFRVASSEWGLPVRNLLAGIRRPAADAPRNRRLQPGEWQRIERAAESCRNPHILPVVQFAIETAMRRSEILAVEWEHVEWATCTIHIPITKTGRPRTIPLTKEAVSVLESQQLKVAERPFPLSAEAFKLAWQRLCKRAGILDLHFHDLRHEAVSRFFEMGLSLAEVATISGHKDPRMLFRYTHLKAADIAAKLNR